MPLPVTPSLLSKSDLSDTAPRRELAYYGAIRQGFEQAFEGLSKIRDASQELLSQDPGNARLEMYLAAVQKSMEKVYRLYTKAARVKVNRGQKTNESIRQ